MKKIAVIILNYKVREKTLKCIKSIRSSFYQNIEIVVVDNNSGDDIAKDLENINDVIFIQNDQNTGYTGGNNLGIRKALDIGADYLFILNSDAWVEKNTIASLVSIAEKDRADIVGPKILFADKKTIWYAGGILDLANVLGKHRGVDEKDNGQYNKEEETDYVTGAALFVHKKVFEKIGLFDEDYFMYMEDSDFCYRARKVGFKIIYNPMAIVYHENAQSAGLGSPLQDYFLTRNRMLFASKFLSFRTKFALFREALRNIANSTRRLAFIDFLLGNLNKGSFL